MLFLDPGLRKRPDKSVLTGQETQDGKCRIRILW
jgi:hypothetical protein